MRKLAVTSISVFLFAALLPSSATSQLLTSAQPPACDVTGAMVTAYVGTSPMWGFSDCSGAWDGNNENQMTAVYNQIAADAAAAGVSVVIGTDTSSELAGEMVPSLDWFIYAFVRKEALLSSEIEGTQAKLVDVLA